MTLTYDLDLQSLRTLVMTYIRLQKFGPEDRVETIGRTDGRPEAIALPPTLMRSVTRPIAATADRTEVDKLIARMSAANSLTRKRRRRNCSSPSHKTQHGALAVACSFPVGIGGRR